MRLIYEDKVQRIIHWVDCGFQIKQSEIFCHKLVWGYLWFLVRATLFLGAYLLPRGDVQSLHHLGKGALVDHFAY